MELLFIPLGADDYDRGKKVLNKAKHPGFVGREWFFRCATKGCAVLAVLDGEDVGIAIVDHKRTFVALSVIPSARGGGVASKLTLHVRPQAEWVKVLTEKASFFERLGYRTEGASEISAAGKFSMQLMRRIDDWSGAPTATFSPGVVAPPPAKKREPKANKFADLSLLEFIPTISPQFQPPYHLGDWLDQFTLIARGEPVRALCALPIRHYKTLTTLHGIVWLLCKDPTARYLFLTHSFDRSRAIGKTVRQLADVAGVGPVVGQNTIEQWRNAQGGGMVIMSAEQSRLGEDVHGVFFDDPLDEHASMEQTRRDDVDETISHYTARCMRFGKPGPVMGVMSRWHPDDPIGRRLLRVQAALPWVYIHKPAVLDEGLPTERAFAPEVWPLEALKKMRLELAEQDPTERIWWSQLMGDPKPPGSTLFRGDPERWTKLPDWTYRLAFGADLAFTQGATSDYFSLVAAKVMGTRTFLLEVMRCKLDAHLIESTCKAFQNKYGRAPIYTYVSGPEVGMVKLMRERGLPFVPLHARYNKLVRAERTIKRWNDHQIVIPAEAPWTKGFLHRVEMFRGEDKGHDDDEIDAMVSLCDGALGGAAGRGVVKTLGKSYSGL